MKKHTMRARYEAAEKLLTKHTRTAVLNGNPKIHWNADGTTFQYERQERSGRSKRTDWNKTDPAESRDSRAGSKCRLCFRLSK